MAIKPGISRFGNADFLATVGQTDDVGDDVVCGCAHLAHLALENEDEKRKGNASAVGVFAVNGVCAAEKKSGACARAWTQTVKQADLRLQRSSSKARRIIKAPNFSWLTILVVVSSLGRESCAMLFRLQFENSI